MIFFNWVMFSKYDVFEWRGVDSEIIPGLTHSSFLGPFVSIMLAKVEVLNVHP